MDIRERIRRALLEAQQRGKQRGLSQRITGKDILPFQQQRQQIGQNVSNFMRQGITNIGNTRLENLPAPNLMAMSKLRSQVKAQPYTPTIREQFTNTIANPITTAFDKNKSPLDRGIGAVQGAFNSTPVGQAWQIGTGGVAGMLKTRRQGGDLTANIRKGISNPMADIATEGLGVQNPFLALGINVLSGNPKSAVGGLRQLKNVKNVRSLFGGVKGTAFKNVDDLVSHNIGGLDRARVNQYKQMILKGEDVAPLYLIKEGSKWGVEDGKHRLQAFKELGINKVPTLELKNMNQKTLQDIERQFPHMGFAAEPKKAQLKGMPTAQQIDEQINGNVPKPVGGIDSFIKSPSQKAKVFYNNKIVEMTDDSARDQFRFGAQRIYDNLGTGPTPTDVGFIKTPDGKFYEISKSNKSAKLVSPDYVAQKMSPKTTSSQNGFMDKSGKITEVDTHADAAYKELKNSKTVADRNEALAELQVRGFMQESGNVRTVIKNNEANFEIVGSPTKEQLSSMFDQSSGKVVNIDISDNTGKVLDSFTFGNKFQSVDDFQKYLSEKGITPVSNVAQPLLSDIKQPLTFQQKKVLETENQNFIAQKLKGTPEIYDRGTGVTGTAIKTGDNTLRYSLIEQDSQLLMPNVIVDKKGTGLGTKFMEAIKELADSKGKNLVIMNVKNPKFFDKFPWLKNERGALRYSPSLPQSGAGKVVKVRPRAKPEPLPWETKPNKVPTAQQIDQQINGGISLKPKSNAVVSPADTTSQTFAESMTLSGNSGKGGFKGLDKEVQDAYQGWVNSIKATPVEGFLKKKDFADLDSKGVNGIFEFQAGNKTGRYKDVKKFFDDKYKTLKDEGIDFNYKKDYLPQLWDNTQEEVAQVFGRNLSLRPSFSIDSIFKDYQEGIAKGLKPRFNSISDLAGWYEQRANKAIADKKFFTFLGNDSFITPANKAPQGWVTLDPDRFPKFSLNIDGDKYSGAYKAPPELGKIINNYLRDPQFDLLTKVANYVSRVKNITLNFGIPGTAINMHGVNILARHTLMGTGGNPVSRWMTGIKYMVNPKSAQHELDKVLIRSPKAIKDGLTLSAEDYTGFGKQAQNLAGQFSKKWEDAFATPLFNKMIPTLKLSSYEELVKNGMDGKNAAKLVNNVYGGINWEQMGRNRDMQNLIRATILAPDWAETTLRLGGNLAKSMNPVHKSVVANRYRTMMATIMASYVAHNVVNKLTSGHYSYENEGGHTFEIEMGYTPDGQKRYFRPYGTALDMVRLPYDIAKSATKGDFSTTFRTLRNRMSIPLGVGIGMATDENYRGQPIGYTGKDKFGNEVPLAQRVTGVGSEVASLFGVPAFSRQFLSTATGQQGLEQGLTQGFELPFRYSNIGKSNIAQQVEPYTKDLKGKELYDFNKGLQGESKFSDNQIEFIKTGDKPNERVQQLIDKRAMNREADKKKEELKATAGSTGGSVSGDMVVTNDGDIIDLSPPTKGEGIGAFANKDWNITKARQVWNANIPKDEKEKAIKKLGLEPKDVRYDALANYDVDIKSQYLISKSPNKDKLYENLLTGRIRSIGDNIFASDGVIDNLYEEGYLTSAERKYFKNLDYNKDGTRKKGSGGKGKKPAKITPPAFKEAPSTKITLSKPKLASVKLEGRKQSKVRPQSVDNFKKELAEIERRVKALV